MPIQARTLAPSLDRVLILAQVLAPTRIRMPIQARTLAPSLDRVLILAQVLAPTRTRMPTQARTLTPTLDRARTLARVLAPTRIRMPTQAPAQTLTQILTQVLDRTRTRIQALVQTPILIRIRNLALVQAALALTLALARTRIQIPTPTRVTVITMMMTTSSVMMMTVMTAASCRHYCDHSHRLARWVQRSKSIAFLHILTPSLRLLRLLHRVAMLVLRESKDHHHLYQPLTRRKSLRASQVHRQSPPSIITTVLRPNRRVMKLMFIRILGVDMLSFSGAGRVGCLN